MRTLCLLAYLALCPLAFAAAPPPAKESDSLAILKKRVGTWEAETIYRKAVWTPKEVKLTGTETGEMTLKGKYLESRSKGDTGETKLLATWDERQSVYRVWYFDSEGVTSQGSGSYDEKAKTLTWDVSVVGVTTVVKWKFVDDDTFEWEMTSKDDSEAVLLDVKGTMKRKR